MPADVELGLWQRQWRADPYEPSALKQRVERETRAMRRFVIGEIAITIVFGGGSLALGRAVASDRRPRARPRRVGLHRDGVDHIVPAAPGRVGAGHRDDDGVSRAVDSAMPAAAGSRSSLSPCCMS